MEASPMSISDEPWLDLDVEEIRLLYPVAPEELGKWMLFYDSNCVDAAWDKAKGLYRNRQLAGISSMKVSTACPNDRASNANSKVIICYCGPSSKQDVIMQYGENLLKKMEYMQQVSSTNFPKFIYYKTDQMTYTGTAATGQTRNYLYRLSFE